MTRNHRSAPDDSTFVAHEPCPACGSSDAGARYDDGHFHCHKCDHHEAAPKEGAEEVAQKPAKKGGKQRVNFRGSPKALHSRGLTEDTCRRWSYHVHKDHGVTWQVAHYLDLKTLQPVALHMRNAEKDFPWAGNQKAASLYGQWLWRNSGRQVVITEGEIDAMTISQLWEHKWPVVSIPGGVKTARKSLINALEWLSGFEKVILCFDMDEPGQEAVQDCVSIFPPGKLYIAHLPLKDANEMHTEGRDEELLNALWGAKQYRPGGIVRARDLRQQVLVDPEMGFPWVFPTLTDASYGRREGELVAIGAGSGVGKTSLCMQMIAEDLGSGEPVAAFMFEQSNEETTKRVAGQFAGKNFHIPDGSWTGDELVKTLDRMDALPDLYLYSHEEEATWAKIEERIRFLYHAHGVRRFYVDPMTAIVQAEQDEERIAIERIVAKQAKLVKQLPIWVGVIHHLATPEGTPHEEGGRVKARHFKGSRAIIFWCHFMIGLERNTQAEDPEERQNGVLRVLKDRATGRATGLTVPFHYDQATGRLSEREEIPVEDGDNEF